MGFPLGDMDPQRVPIEDIEKMVRSAEGELETLVYGPPPLRSLVTGSLRAFLLVLGTLDYVEEDAVSFLMTFEYFVTAVVLFKSIILLYRSPVLPSCAPASTTLLAFKWRQVSLLSIWISLRYSSLHLLPQVVNMKNQFLEFLKLESPEHAEAISSTWLHAEEQALNYQEKKMQLWIHPSPKIKNDLQLKFLSIPAKEMAQQLTLLEQMYFQNVRIEEFYEQAWEYEAEENASNLGTLLERFGEICYWVATEVVQACDPEGQPSVQQRAQTISKFIHIMQELALLKNFNSVMEIYAGLNLPSIGKLVTTWNHVPKSDKDIMNEVGDLMSCNDNYRNYRNILDTISGTPCLPFVSLLLRDLTFIEEEPTFLDGVYINFQKMALLSTVFSQLSDFRSQLYDFPSEPSIQAYFQFKNLKTQEEIQIISENIFNAQENDELEDGQMIEGTVCEMLLLPEVYTQFHNWLSLINREDLHCLECWQAMYEYFKMADFGDTEYAALTLRETAKDIYYLYLQMGAPKYIGAVNAEILEEINQKLISDTPIQNDLFDDIIEGCCSQLEHSWEEFSQTANI